MGTLETFNKDFVFFFLFSSHFFKRDKQHLNHSVDGSLCTEQENMKKKKHTNDREWMDQREGERCSPMHARNKIHNRRWIICIACHRAPSIRTTFIMCELCLGRSLDFGSAISNRHSVALAHTLCRPSAVHCDADDAENSQMKCEREIRMQHRQHCAGNGLAK